MSNDSFDNTHVSRRALLKRAALVAPASLVSGVTVAAGVCSIPEKWDKECDVVVIGGGGAALQAALQAHEAGGSVILCNKSANSYFSATALCGGAFTAFNSTMQREAGIHDSANALVEDMLAYGGYWADPALLHTYALYSGQAFDWLQSHGLAKGFLEKYSEFRTTRTIRQEAFSGRDYIDALTKAMVDAKIERHDNCSLSRIIYDAEKNEVLGVEVEEKSRKHLIRARKGVVLAAGGYMGNVEFVDRWVPTLGGVGVVLNVAANNGDALMTTVRDVGAPITHMQFTGSYPNGALDEEGARNGRIFRSWYFVDEGAIYVSKTGRRFVRETMGTCQIAPMLGALPEKRNFCVMEKDVWDAVNAKYPNGTFGGWTAEQVQAAVKKGGLVFFGDTIEETAEKAGVDPKGLLEQISLWNKAVESGVDTQFGCTGMKRKIEKAPFCIVKLASYSVISGGGLRCNKDLQVLRWDNKPVGRLYAAGEIIGAVHGNAYCAGCGIGTSQTFGWVAGHNVMGKPLPNVPEEI